MKLHAALLLRIATNATACVAVGDSYTFPGPGAKISPLAETWNGTGWQIQVTRDPAGSSFTPTRLDLPSEGLEGPHQKAFDYSFEEQEIIEQRLAELGYLE